MSDIREDTTHLQYMKFMETHIVVDERALVELARGAAVARVDVVSLGDRVAQAGQLLLARGLYDRLAVRLAVAAAAMLTRPLDSSIDTQKDTHC